MAMYGREEVIDGYCCSTVFYVAAAATSWAIVDIPAPTNNRTIAFANDVRSTSPPEIQFSAE